MAITAGIGSDHVDLQAAMDNKIDVVEVTYCNSRSILNVMMIVSMVRDYHNQHRIVNEGGWNIDAVQDHMMLKTCILELLQLVELV